MDLSFHLLTNLCTYDSALSSFEVSIRMLMNSTYLKVIIIYYYSGLQQGRRIYNTKVVKKEFLLIEYRHKKTILITGSKIVSSI